MPASHTLQVALLTVLGGWSVSTPSLRVDISQLPLTTVVVGPDAAAQLVNTLQVPCRSRNVAVTATKKSQARVADA